MDDGDEAMRKYKESLLGAGAKAKCTVSRVDMSRVFLAFVANPRVVLAHIFCAICINQLMIATHRQFFMFSALPPQFPTIRAT